MRGSWEPSWRQARSPELVWRGSLARRGTLLQASRWSELSGCRLHRRLELRLKNELFFPAARFTLLIHSHCCARAAERTASYAAPWKSVRMHAISSAIAGSLRTSTAPTGSRPLPPSGFPPPRLDAQPRANAEATPLHLSRIRVSRPGRWPRPLRVASPAAGLRWWSTRSQLQGRQSSSGSMQWLP